MMNYQKEGERIDDLGIAGYHILQKPGAFCFGMDAVLLADFAEARKNEQVLDLCSGTGIIPILMKARYPEAVYTGLEIQEEMTDMAERSVRMNGLEHSIRMIHGDLKEIRSLLPGNQMHVVTVNPPYIKGVSGLKNQTEAVTGARHEVLCTLEDVLAASAYVLRSSGRLYMVHQPRRLPEILSAMQQYHLEPKRMRFVHPYIDKEPNLVLIEAVKGGGPQLTVLAPLIVYDAPGQYRDEIYRIYHIRKV